MPFYMTFFVFEGVPYQCWNDSLSGIDISIGIVMVQIPIPIPGILSVNIPSIAIDV